MMENVEKNYITMKGFNGVETEFEGDSVIVICVNINEKQRKDEVRRGIAGSFTTYSLVSTLRALTQTITDLIEKVPDELKLAVLAMMDVGFPFEEVHNSDFESNVTLDDWLKKFEDSK